ncbi:hypothetical protein [Mucilaginibacter pedocola]|uniref:Uncharacterized protein n=1 Tax=Mucilaginibacter pedocola TaxID=1792845 RepID=A0A1S9P7B5_9SPHI|nr:hypothetical protein [Mucilaginibacter pedocola]OOQ56845.1 hypothetical protein BC343_17850 [Mucilaginibacter pedocola]
MFFLPAGEKQLTVISKANVWKLHPVFALKDADIIIKIRGDKYLLWSREYYDSKGEIDSLIENHDIDYLHWTRSEMYKMKGFFNHGYIRNISAWLIDNKRLKINNSSFEVVSMNKLTNEIYYRSPKEPDHLYIIKYR